jgi:hypothetical protein
MNKDRKRMDLNNRNNQLIIAGMAGLIDDGLTPHEVFEVLDDIKNQTFPALAEMYRGNKAVMDT